jgi:alginate O-acetyltransferase complex protein AlgI
VADARVDRVQLLDGHRRRSINSSQDWPYVARSVQEFWRRWHISLSTWFRDYLYVPLGGNRLSPARMYGNLVTVFFLCGLWHGASWNFVIWGVWHGTFLVIERVASNRGGRRERSAHQPVSASSASFAGALRHLYTLAVVMIGWVFFRAETLAGAVAFLEALAGLSPALPAPLTVQWYLTNDVLLALAAGAIGSTPWLPALAARLERVPFPARFVEPIALMAVLVVSLMHVAARTYSPFIYFRF